MLIIKVFLCFNILFFLLLYLNNILQSVSSRPRDESSVLLSFINMERVSKLFRTCLERKIYRLLIVIFDNKYTIRYQLIAILDMIINGSQVLFLKSVKSYLKNIPYLPLQFALN